MGNSPDNKDKNDFGKFNPFNNEDNNNGPQNKLGRNIFIWLMIGGSIIILLMLSQSTYRSEWPISYTKYKQFLMSDKIASATITKSQLNDYEFHGVLRSSETILINGKEEQITKFVTKLGVLDQETEALWAQKGISWDYEEGDSDIFGTIYPILTLLILIFIFFFMMKRIQGGGNSKGLFSFGKAKVKMHNPHEKRITFQDVAGADEAKEELVEVIEFLKNPAKFQKLGGKIPKGVLLVGPPGTGKTLLARAVAGEAEVPFYSISGADFVEMFVGVGASRVRDMFETAKKSNKCLIFIDELDAVGRQRGAGLGGGHDEREQTLNQLLVEMDGFEQNSGIIIIAATNRPDVLDPALLRPGRFDRQIVVDRPDVKGREGILKVHTKKMPISDDVNLEIIAKGTPGFSGADLANLVNEAALLAARRDSDKVTMYDVENAKDKVMMGVERKSMVISDEEKKVTAYHEMGHALAGVLQKDGDPVHKVTIIPRGRALGVTAYLPNENFHSYSRDYLNARLVALLAGRAAENIVFSIRSTGASNDLKRATQMAKKMVCEWGMSDVLGPVTYNNEHDEVFLGREISQPRDHSEKTAQLIDQEVKNILEEANIKAETLLNDNIELLHRASKFLVQRESIDREELLLIVDGKDLPPISKDEINAIKNMSFDKDKIDTNGHDEEKKQDKIEDEKKEAGN